MQDWFQNCYYDVNNGVNFENIWQSALLAQPCNFYTYPPPAQTPHTWIYSIAVSTLNNPSTELLDGNKIQLNTAITLATSASCTSLFPQLPLTAFTEPEMTVFFILKVGNNFGVQNKMLRWRGDDANSDFIIYMAGLGNNYLTFFTRSSNGNTVQVNDTVDVQGDGNYYLVCIQYSYTTKISRLIINGRDLTGIDLGQDTFDFNAAGSATFYLGQGISLGNFIGSIGDMAIYGTALLTNANINSLANNYYLKRYPSLVWSDV